MNKIVMQKPFPTTCRPQNCNSGVLDYSECEGCEAKPTLDTFRHWVSASGAVKKTHSTNCFLYVVYDRRNGPR